MICYQTFEIQSGGQKFERSIDFKSKGHIHLQHSDILSVCGYVLCPRHAHDNLIC